MKKYPVLSWLSKVKESMAIVQETDTATVAISKGKYVLWKNNMYKAKSNISANATLSSRNLTAVSGGGLNSLLTDISNSIDTVNSSISTLSTSVGNLNSLSTSAKSTIVAAINEVDSHADAANTRLSGIEIASSSTIASSVNVPRATYYKMGTRVLTPGYYILSYTASFDYNDDGYYGQCRDAFIASDESSATQPNPTQMNIACRSTASPVYRFYTRFNVVTTFNITSNTTLHFYMRHDAEYSLACSARVSYIKIPRS